MINRYIRMRDAPIYLGMDRHRFNKEVRPGLTPIPIGKQGLAFDRLDLDAWADHYKQCNGRPASKNTRRQLWDEKKHQDFKKSVVCGTSIRRSTTAEFAKVLEQVGSKKQKDT